MVFVFSILRMESKMINKTAFFLLLATLLFSGCQNHLDYRGMEIDPTERHLGYLSAENGHCLLPFILGGYTKGPKSIVYSAPFMSWYVNSKQHKGFAFIAPFIVYDIDTIYYASDNRMAGYRNLTFWILGLFGRTYQLTGVHREKEVEHCTYWFFPLFRGGENENGRYFDLFMFIPLF